MSKLLHKKYCQKCKIKNVPLIKNSKVVRKEFIHQYYICRECNNKKRKKYYENNKEKCREIIYRSIEKHKSKQLARYELHKKINKKELFKKNFCERCDKKSGKIEAHHTDYTKPLSVVWLCSSCHAAVHKSVV